jgi:aspartate oxidase
MLRDARTALTNVLVIGSGGAGLRAAIAAHDAGSEVTIVGKRLATDAHTVLASGGINAALGTVDPDDEPRWHFADTWSEGYELADPLKVELFVHEAPERIRELDAWGMPFARTEDGDIDQRYFGAHRYRRTCYAGDWTGRAMMETLHRQVVERGVPIVERTYVSRLLVHDGTCFGATTFDLASGERVAHIADAVVLAGGGHTRLWRRSSSRRGENHGDAMYLALAAGVPLADLELVQFHPTGMTHPEEWAGQLVTEAMRGEGGRLYNADGERFMERYDPDRLELSSRDRVAMANYTEIQEGRGGPNGGVFLDLTHLDQHVLREQIPRMYRQMIEAQLLDISQHPVEVAPTAHYSMGGVTVEPETGATRVDYNSAFGDRGDQFVSPKVEASYVISDEDFMAGVMNDAFTSLRLRGAWGRTGRSPDPETALERLGASPFALADGTVRPGAVPVNPGNPDLRPEIGEEFEIGFDAGFWNERVGLDVTWFDKRSKDLLLERPLPPSLGFSQDPFVNIGELQNRGLEVGLDAQMIRREELGLDIRLSVSTLDQKVTDLGEVEPFGGATRVMPGLQPFARFSHLIREVDVANNRAIVSDTMEFAGNNTPDFEGSASATLTLFRNFRFYGQVDWMTGFVIYNNTDQFRERQFGTGERWILRDQILTDEERLRRFGPFHTESDPDGDALSSSLVNEEYFERGDFARLRELSLTYTLPEQMSGRFGARAASLTLAARNLALWTGYNGADPEVLQANTNFTRSDFLTVPPARRWVVRANVTF